MGRPVVILFLAGLLALVAPSPGAAETAQLLPPAPAVVTPVNTWTGAASGLWSDPANWSLFHMPLAGEDARVGPAANQPLVDGDFGVHGLVLSSGAVLSVASGQVLDVGGDLFISGEVAGAGRLRLSGGDLDHWLHGVFTNLELDDSLGAVLVADSQILGELTLTNGDLDLGDRVLTLGPAALLVESPGNTVGGADGLIETVRIFSSALNNEDVAGLGAVLSTQTLLGETTIRRGHGVQPHPEKSGLARWFEIEAANNSGLNATLAFHYDVSELDSVLVGREAGLALFRYNGAAWEARGGVADPDARVVTLDNIDAFSRWTLFGDSPFTDVEAGLAGLDLAHGLWGDYDIDGDLDFLLTGEDQILRAQSRLYRNDSSAFSLLSTALPGAAQVHPAWGDLDRDGDLDLALDGRVYINNAGVFSLLAGGPARVDEASAAWGDYDGDGDLDLALGGENLDGGFTRIYRNDGPGGLVDAEAGLDQVQASGLAWGDYDLDLDLDLIAGGRLYRNDGGDFVRVAPNLPELAADSVAWGDFDGDGDLDLALAGLLDGLPVFRLYENVSNPGSTSFIDTASAIPGTAHGQLAWGDHDNDGDLDLAVTGNLAGGTGLTRVYRNEAGQFGDALAGLPGLAFSTLAWGDFDGDLDLDLLLAGNDGTRHSRVYRNNSVSVNSPPALPAGVAVIGVSPDSLILGWDQAADGQTPGVSLHYNLRLGTASQGIDRLAPMADVTDGFRLVPALGNAQHNRAMELVGLDPGQNYFWAVQAMDSAFAGSAFSVEQAARISDFHAVATAPISNVGMDSASGGGTVDAGGATVVGRGLVWHIAPRPTLAVHSGMSSDGTGDGPFSSTLSGLSPGLTYFVRAYATDNGGLTAYGAEKVFAAAMIPPGNSLDFGPYYDRRKVDVAHELLGNPTASFTLEAWVAVGEQFYEAGELEIASKKELRDNIVVLAGYGLSYLPPGPYGNGQLLGRLAHAGEDGWTMVSAPVSLYPNTWRHVALVYDDAADQLRLHIDGVLAGLVSVPKAPEFSTEDLRIGRPFTGRIDELRLWYRAHSAAEIRADLCRVLDGDESGLAASYRFDQLGGQILVDHSGHDRHGRLHFMAAGDWLPSAAALGHQSSQVYTANWSGVTLDLVHGDGDSVRVDQVNGGPVGLHLYLVDSGPADSLPPPGYALLGDRRSWGLYVAGGADATYRFRYDYSGHPVLGPDSLMALAIRDDPVSAWAYLATAVDPDGQVLTATGQGRGDYILGLYLDADHDGIGDGWEMYHFGNLTSATAASDFDRDGYSDLQEYLNGRNGELDPQGRTYDPKVKNAPGGTGGTRINILFMVVPVLSGAAR